MAKLIPRNELFKEEIKKTNKYISDNADIFNFDAYVNSCLDELIKIDSEYYTNLKKKLSTEYDNFQFHLDHDIQSDPNNYEIIASIEEVLAYLKELETRDIGLFDENALSLHFDEKNFYSNELKELYFQLIDINNSHLTAFKNSVVSQTNYAGLDNKTLAKNILSSEKRKEISEKIAPIKNKSEIINQITKSQNIAMFELEKNKKKYKFNIKWFIIIFVMFAAIGILGIFMVFFV